MTLKEAIEIMENDPPMPHPLDVDKIDQAERLGLEAMKRLQDLREYYLPIGRSPLPSETKE